MGRETNRLAQESGLTPDNPEGGAKPAEETNRLASAKETYPPPEETNRLASQQERPPRTAEETEAAQGELEAVQGQIKTLEGMGDRANVSTLESLRAQEQRLQAQLGQEEETGQAEQ
ncbi:hypothetical protein KJ782_00085 [Patescibacteria group bacterium]|nr:hypothetical protein [Patescibacteria group bacterium]